MSDTVPSGSTPPFAFKQGRRSGTGRITTP